MNTRKMIVLALIIVVMAVASIAAPSAEARPHLPRKAARGVGVGLKWVKNHIPLVRRLGRISGIWGVKP